MEINTKNVIIGSTLVLVFVLVLFNIDMFVGNASRELQGSKELGIVTTIKVVPDVIEAGDYLNVQIIPGSKCAEKKVSVYKVGKAYAAATFNRPQLGPLEGYRFCNPTVASYKSRSDWSGDYYVLVKDLGSNSYVKATFTVE
jgi:hypothetical protein